MKLTNVTRKLLAVRREDRRMEQLGYTKCEPVWQLLRGDYIGWAISDARISVCGRCIFTKIGKREGI